jgi:putative endonuclease
MGGWTYMLRCSDGSLYVGSTSYRDVNVRVAEHNEARYFGYTSARRPVTLVRSQWFDDLRDAQAMERRLKGWVSKRRASKPKSELGLSRRQLADQFHSLGVRHPEVAAKRPSKDDR